MIVAFTLLSLATSIVDQRVTNSFDQQLLSEFETVCSDLSSLETVRNAASDNGWHDYQASPDSVHAKSLSSFSKLLAPEDLEIVDFTKLVSGKDIVLSLSDVQADGGSSLTCRMHYYSAVQAISEADVSASVGQKPIQAKDDKNLTARAWFPGLKPEHSGLQAIYVPSDSPLVNEVNLKGVILIARQKKDAN